MIKVAQVSAGTCIPVGAERERQEQAEKAQIPDRGQGIISPTENNTAI